MGRKNDNPFVEQKNWSVVRRLVGYLRYDRPRQVTQLNRLYERYRLYVNFFLPVTKLKQKVRVGSRVKRLYDPPQTPYARLLASTAVNATAKHRLRAMYVRLDVIALKQEIDDGLDALLAPPAKVTFIRDGSRMVRDHSQFTSNTARYFSCGTC